MKASFDKALPVTLAHEGGWSDHPKDPGGATNMGVTIGTLKRLGIDVDGDGDSDLADLRKLSRDDVARVYRTFYWDAVKGDLLPAGVDMAVFDFAVNSGPSRAAQHLQRVLGVAADGDIGPKTLAALAKADPVKTIAAIKESRLRFLRALKTWPTFGKGWENRVKDVTSWAMSLAIVAAQGPKANVPPRGREVYPAPAPVTPGPALEPLTGKNHGGFWAAIIAGLLALLPKSISNRMGPKP